MKPNSKDASAPIIDFLRRHDGAAALLPAAQRNLRLGQDTLALLPAALRDGCEVAGCDDAILILRVSSAGAAAKLRQTLPRLLEGLIGRGWQVSLIRVRVQPGAPNPQREARKKKKDAAISPGGLAAFADLRATLTDSPLKAAVDRLIRRRRV